MYIDCTACSRGRVHDGRPLSSPSCSQAGVSCTHTRLPSATQLASRSESFVTNVYIISMGVGPGFSAKEVSGRKVIHEEQIRRNVGSPERVDACRPVAPSRRVGRWGEARVWQQEGSKENPK